MNNNNQISNNHCFTCGKDSLKYYDGALGYEAMKCTTKNCNTIYDYQGTWINGKLVGVKKEIDLEPVT